MSPDKLAYMANQIGRFFAHQPHDKAVAAIADHIEKFWDPRMRSEILAHLQAVQLDPAARQAIEQLQVTVVESI
jgi:formate dehydrogenase subunit delta